MPPTALPHTPTARVLFILPLPTPLFTARGLTAYENQFGLAAPAVVSPTPRRWLTQRCNNILWHAIASHAAVTFACHRALHWMNTHLANNITISIPHSTLPFWLTVITFYLVSGRSCCCLLWGHSLILWWVLDRHSSTLPTPTSGGTPRHSIFHLSPQPPPPPCILTPLHTHSLDEH